MQKLLDKLLEKYPGLAVPEVGARLARVLSEAYGFDIAKSPTALDEVDLDTALAAVEVLQAAEEMAERLVETISTGRTSLVVSAPPKPKK